MKELNEEDLNERLNEEGDLMKELTEEEMKREGGACMGDRYKSGYKWIATKQKRGWYKIDSVNLYAPKFTLRSYEVGNKGGGSPGNPVITGVEIRKDGLYVYTPYGSGWCTLKVKYWQNVMGGRAGSITVNIQFVLG